MNLVFASVQFHPFDNHCVRLRHFFYLSFFPLYTAKLHIVVSECLYDLHWLLDVWSEFF